ncbi:Autophagy-related protein 13 N-terminal [Arabidopsis thaliana x Arabidopsis arenosa]|uniref:Autophagy-related protein 13 N-terminal n=1 Tax=Arabidopsis thaliana x Arabidopsis arenosa TaxID=1240361 RepID=A0A8T1ZPT7_9BRAS|nr:Autophagy-related protein 13 N-terminal [Arabidopsis thaliana x Arabidopsis arenosa]
MDFPENLPSDIGRLEQIVSHFFPKALHIVLNSRIPSLQSRGRSRERLSGLNVRKSDKWFNLVMGDRPPALEKLHSWHRNILDSMIIDIILVHPISNDNLDVDDDHHGDSTVRSAETVIERWVVQYENPLIMSPQSSESATRYQKVYKKSIILLRSLYAQTRLLPAYRVSRQLSSSLASSGYDLIYKVSSFSDIFSGPVTETMKEFRFAPVEVPPGRLCASVTYRSDLSDFNLGAHITLPPRIITDYVGSPATDPMRFFPSPGKSVEGNSFIGRAGRPPLTGSSAERPHSWTSGFHRPPAQYPTPNQSFSPAHSHQFSPGLHDFHWSRTDAFGDNHQLSPPFSPSGSPSTPRYISGGNSPRINVRPGTAPVTIPSSATFNRYVSSNFSEPGRNPLPPFSPKSTRRSPSSQDSLPGIALYRSSRSGESPSGLMNQYPAQKLSKDSKYDSGRFSGVLSSSDSPRFGFSRSPSRLSSQDDLDDPDCSCPFDFDDVDESGLQYSQSLDRRKTSSSISQSLPLGRRSSQDAAVGVLVHMLKTAPPLRQDSSTYMASMSGVQREGSVSGTESEFSMARSTSDALEELRNYKQLKDLLLSKSKSGSGATRVH